MTPTGTTATIRSALRHLDVGQVSDAARHEARSRQNHLPPVSVYRWWARRTEAVGGAVLDAFSKDRPGRLRVADPFAGGGVLGLAVLMRGHQLYAQDVNPWAAQSLATTLSLPSADVLARAGDRLAEAVAPIVSEAYSTKLGDGTPAEVAHTLRVAVAACVGCSSDIRLFPGGLVSMIERVDLRNGSGDAYLACPAGHVQLGTVDYRSRCCECDRVMVASRRYTSGRSVRCSACNWKGRISDLTAARPLRFEVVLVERRAGAVREIGPPTTPEQRQASDRAWHPSEDLPAIGDNNEAAVLRRHGFRNWHDLYPARQRVVLEALLAAVDEAAEGDERIASALRTAVLGSVEMAGSASRWDGRYLKAYEAVANHRFSFTTLPVEPHVWGAGDAGRGTVSRRLRQLEKAAVWLEEQTGRPLVVQGALDVDSRRRRLGRSTDARIVSGSSARMLLAEGDLDLCLTDPPYHDDVQYGDLSELFRAWAGLGTDRIEGEAVVSAAAGLAGYEAALTDVFREIGRCLADDGHLILSYANRSPDAWVALLRALDTAGFSAVGFEVVHSENELDHSKAGKRACTMDVLVDLILARDGHPVVRHRPSGEPTGDEEAFCRLVGTQALEVGRLGAQWEKRFRTKLAASAFLTR